MEKKLIVFIDSGDTLINEGTEKRDENDVVYQAEMIEGAREVLERLYDQGYTISLVADGLVQSFANMYDKVHKLGHCFTTRIISEELQVEKPHQLMFETTLKSLGLDEKDKNRIIMVGNNVERDIVGANRFGITSVLLNWSPRYRMIAETEEETPDYIISTPKELLKLVEDLNSQL